MRRTALSLAAILLCAASAARAYRPFDNTDADTAKTGEIELEVGPAGFTHQSGQTTYSPLFIFNYGFLPGYEVVLEYQNQLVLGTLTGGPRESVGSGELTVKHVLREGVLQGGEGPSVALEMGAFLPGIKTQSGFGAIATGIISQRFGLATLHLNVNLGLQRDGNFWTEPALVAEGPESWTVRPVAEVLYGHEFGGPNEASTLLGGIWKIDDDLALDLGLRAGREAGAPVEEIRCGFTISF